VRSNSALTGINSNEPEHRRQVGDHRADFGSTTVKSMVASPALTLAISFSRKGLADAHRDVFDQAAGPAPPDET